jgi:hypothetical protein
VVLLTKEKRLRSYRASAVTSLATALATVIALCWANLGGAPVVSQAPVVALQVNGLGEASVTPGTPLVFKVTLSNREAREAAHARKAYAVTEQDLAARVAEGTLSREEADARRRRWAPTGAVPAIRLSVAEKSFSFSLAGKPPRKSPPWVPVFAGPVNIGPVTLDGERTVAVVFAVPPEGTSGLEGKSFDVLVSFESRAAAAGLWAGAVESRPVRIVVLKDRGTITERMFRLMATARYFLALHQIDGARKAADELLAIEPTYIESLVLRGEVFEAAGDDRQALESYKSARSELRKQFPGDDGSELQARIERLWEKLGIGKEK